MNKNFFYLDKNNYNITDFSKNIKYKNIENFESNIIGSPCSSSAPCSNSNKNIDKEFELRIKNINDKIINPKLKWSKLLVLDDNIIINSSKNKIYFIDEDITSNEIIPIDKPSKWFDSMYGINKDFIYQIYVKNQSSIVEFFRTEKIKINNVEKLAYVVYTKDNIFPNNEEFRGQPIYIKMDIIPNNEYKLKEIANLSIKYLNDPSNNDDYYYKIYSASTTNRLSKYEVENFNNYYETRIPHYLPIN